MNKKKSQYEQAYDGEWYDIAEVQHVACCDCGLVHSLEHRIGPDGKVQIRFKRLSHHTAALRRHYRHEFKKA